MIVFQFNVFYILTILREVYVGSWNSFYKFAQVIPGGGILVLGQEQDIVGGNFTASEAFYGHISQVNIWDRILSSSNIQKLSSYCAFEIYGNLVAWGDFLNGFEGGAEKIQPSRACQGTIYDLFIYS